MHKRLGRRCDGAVYVEFLLAIIPVLLLFLWACQLALVTAGRLVVQHAATVATRAAIVVLEDDPRHYEGEPRGLIDEAGSPPESRTGKLLRVLREKAEGLVDEMRGGHDTQFNLTAVQRGGPRLTAIRWAAYVPLAALAPPPGTAGTLVGVDGQSVASALGSVPAARAAIGLALYNRAAAAITFPESPGSSTLRTGCFERDEDITVRVTYLYHCAIPIVSRMMCDSVFEISGLGDSWRALGDTARQALGEARSLSPARLRQLRDELADRVGEHTATAAELSHAEAPGLLLPLGMSDAHFAVLRAEATLPIQGAGYEEEHCP